MDDTYEAERQALCAAAQAATTIPRYPGEDEWGSHGHLAHFSRLADRGCFLDLFILFREYAAGMRERFRKSGDIEAITRLDAIHRQLDEARAYERIHGIGSLMKPRSLNLNEAEYLCPDIASLSAKRHEEVSPVFFRKVGIGHEFAHWRQLLVREQGEVKPD